MDVAGEATAEQLRWNGSGFPAGAICPGGAAAAAIELASPPIR
jgi:hypothetical protein